MLKTVVLHNISVETDTFYFSGFTDEHKSLKEQHLFEIEIICDIINDFTVTFDQFNVSLMNKSTAFLKKILLTPIIIRLKYLYIIYIKKHIVATVLKWHCKLIPDLVI